MTNRLYREEDVRNIADAIRAKNGSATRYRVADMAGAIGALPSSDAITHESIPAYVKGEALRVAALVKERQDTIRASGSTPFTMLCISDAHDAPEGSGVSTAASIVAGNRHAGMAAKVIAYACHLDACAFLGDYAWGYDKASTADNLADIASVTADIDEAFAGIPQFRTVGNHDSGAYEDTTALTPAQLYARIGRYSADSGATMGSTVGGWCHRDFAANKVRVVCLNTADASTNAVSAAQAKWFASTLLSTPSGYDVIVLAHHPADYGGNAVVANVIHAAYTKGTITAGGTSYDFSKFAGRIACQFHGHVHCYLADRINHVEASKGTPFDVKRIAVPNSCFARNNEYGTAASYFGIVFGEAKTYAKTADSAQDTAFVVNVYDPGAFMMWSYHYGAGYDRSVYLGKETIAVRGVSFAEISGTLSKGGTLTLTPVFSPQNATDTSGTWSTSNPSVATVSGGVVTAVGVGGATIAFTSTDGGFKATYALTVEAVTTSVPMTRGHRVSTSSGSVKEAADYDVTDYIPIDKATYPDGRTITISGADDCRGNGNPYRDCSIVLYNASKALVTSSYVDDKTWFGWTLKLSADRSGVTVTGAAIGSDYAYMRIAVYDTSHDCTCVAE